MQLSEARLWGTFGHVPCHLPSLLQITLQETLHRILNGWYVVWSLFADKHKGGRADTV